MRLTAWMGDGSRGYLAGVTIFLCLLSLVPILVAFLWGYRTNGLVAAALTASVCGVWFELVYFAPKALNEVVATHLFLPGIYLGVHGRCLQPRTRLFLAGCLCGLALALRIHLFPAIAFAVAYICRKDWRGRWLPTMAGILCPILAFGVVDAFTWSYPFQSIWKNVWVNVVEAKSLEFGVSPWYEYLLFGIKSWSLALVPIALLVASGARRSPILAWLTAIVVLSHSVLAHKEYRFIYPVLPMLMILAGLGTVELVTRSRPKLSLWRMVAVVLVCLLLWTSTSAVLASRFNLDRKPSFSMLWSAPKRTYWKRQLSNLLAFQKLSTEQALCGVGLLGIPLYTSGGYTYLHRDVPIFLIEQDIAFNQLAPSFNYLVTNVPVPPQHHDYALQQCWRKTCIYKRLGSCTQIKGYDINQLLKQRGN